MSYIQHTKLSTRFTMAWSAICLIAVVLFVSGCGGDQISYGEALPLDGTNLKGPTSAIHKDSPEALASFIEKLWGEVWNGVTHRTRQMTGNQVPPGRTLSDSS